MKITSSQKSAFTQLKENSTLESVRHKKKIIGILQDEGRTEKHIEDLVERLSFPELTINFDPTHRFRHGTKYGREVVYALRESRHFLTQWEVALSHGADAVEGEDYFIKRRFIEEEEFGYCLFKEPNRPTEQEAIERPRYAALNIFNELGGAKHYGNAALILSPAVLEHTTFTCRDSYKYYQNQLRHKKVGTLAPSFPAYREYLPSPGTSSALYHQLYKLYLDGQYQLANNIQRTNADFVDWKNWCDHVLRAVLGYYPVSSFGYWEAQIHGVIQFPLDVIGLQADCMHLGTPVGDCLHEWAKDWDWPLTWCNFEPLGPQKMFLDPLTGPARYHKLGPRAKTDEFAGIFFRILKKADDNKSRLFNTLWEKAPPYLRFRFRDDPDTEISDQLAALTKSMTVPAS